MTIYACAPLLSTKYLVLSRGYCQSTQISASPAIRAGSYCLGPPHLRAIAHLTLRGAFYGARRRRTLAFEMTVRISSGIRLRSNAASMSRSFLTCAAALNPDAVQFAFEPAGIRFPDDNGMVRGHGSCAGRMIRHCGSICANLRPFAGHSVIDGSAP
jgi:hypothetical protein